MQFQKFELSFKKIEILKKILTSTLLLLILNSCAKTNYDGSSPIKPFGNQNQQVPPQNSDLPPSSTTPPVGSAKKLPVISFVLDEVTLNANLEAQLELQLSEVTDRPVIAVVNLVHGTAIPYRDYIGYKPLSSDRSVDRFSRTIVIPPGATRMPLPMVGGSRTTNCDSHFFAKIDYMKLKQAKVFNNTAKVIIPCKYANLPPIVVPIPEPTPELPVTARFEEEYIKTKEHKKRTSVKVILDRPSNLPVMIDIETQNGSAYEDIDYVKVKVQLVIQPGETSIELPIELVRAHRCKPEDWPRHHRDGKFEFHVVVTEITNATMPQPTSTIRVKKDVDDDRGCKSPPQS